MRWLLHFAGFLMHWDYFYYSLSYQYHVKIATPLFPFPVLTTSGEQCTFPFIVNGMEYNTCITASMVNNAGAQAPGPPWCRTTTNSEGEWGEPQCACK